MTADRHGHALTDTGAEAAALLEQGLDDMLFLRPAVAEAAAGAVEAAPGSPSAQVFAAYLGLLGTEEKDAAQTLEWFGRFRAGLDRAAATPRELAHVDAVSAWLEGDIHKAGRLLGEVSVAYPRDLLALAVGHQIDFFTGNAVQLRDRVGGVLSAWDDADPHYGLLLGMFAFGLEEAGHYDRSEQVGLAAVEANPRDVWGIHAVVHTYEMQGRFAEGIAYLDARTDDWSSGNYLNVHNWWHYALYALESGNTAQALEIYDASIHTPESEGLAMELLDASALLWRLLLAGEDESERWARLADAWAARRDGPYYAFNDVHALMAYLGAGRIADAEALVKERQVWLAAPHPGVANHAMTEEIGVPVGRALIAYAQGRYDQTVDLLLPLRHRLNTYGGSHAQRDAVQKTLVEAALRAGRDDVARTLLSERIGVRPSSPYNWLAQARLADRLGRAAEAAAARRRAGELVDATK
ncbi:tetratricopeptide repeat protein [Yinghuangia soli]|uniref:Tetratricopeptide repeat protein 38 n=1 Tax=Yinghuangia soli TaxID=2908204 RepID=A0AA41PXH7_9ACTN|nr:tetratricopeptide repeat protein [Yinghuangia soli]MCF2527377.1 tetratricopeptide repeat protein [Yinghuangia soli]